jgi:hypothetical protein
MLLSVMVEMHATAPSGGLRGHRPYILVCCVGCCRVCALCCTSLSCLFQHGHCCRLLFNGMLFVAYGVYPTT